MRHRLALAMAVLFSVLLGIGCVDGSSSTSGTALYAYDASTSQVLVWDDLTALRDSASAPIAPTRTLSGSIISNIQSSGSTLAWGGMAFDASSNRLYLVSTTGTVVRIEGASKANGALTSSLDIVTFYLGDSGNRLSSGHFGQMAVDPAGTSLYVTEANDQTSRVWKVSNPGNLADTSTVTLTDVAESGDQGGTGIAAGPGGALYGYFEKGNDLIDNLNYKYSGQRLRSGSGALSNKVLIGGNTHLAKYGSLAFDYGNNRLFVAVHTTDASVTTEPILVFSTGTFATGWNQAPDQVLAPADCNKLRIISHPGNKDWLVGAESTAGAGSNVLWIWETPLDSSSTPTKLLLSSGQILGLALDGSNG